MPPSRHAFVRNGSQWVTMVCNGSQWTAQHAWSMDPPRTPLLHMHSPLRRRQAVQHRCMVRAGRHTAELRQSPNHPITQSRQISSPISSSSHVSTRLPSQLLRNEVRHGRVMPDVSHHDVAHAFFARDELHQLHHSFQVTSQSQSQSHESN